MVYIINNNGIRRRNIQAGFDDRGADQNVHILLQKPHHRILEVLFFHLTVGDGKPGPRNQYRQFVIDFLDGLDPIMYKKYLPRSFQLIFYRMLYGSVFIG